jgi:hypothetical protein
MELEEIKDFLRKKQGYLKEGGKRLRNILGNKGFQTTIALCKQAVREVNIELRDNTPEGIREQRILIYDIETSFNIGWFWRTGFKVNISPEQIIEERAIICISYKWLGEDQVYNLTWDKNHNDKFLLEQFIEVMNEADMIVAHNGDDFDLKWIKTRAFIHGLKMLIDYPQFDTLKVARKKFNFQSNKLDYISKILGEDGKIPTNINLWKKIILGNDKDALKEMITYCDEDVRQLEHVFKVIQGWEHPKFHLGVLQGKTKQTSPISGGVNLALVKTVTTNRGTSKMIMQDLDTDRLFEMSLTNYGKWLLTNK